jgi:hypothetical protein
VSSDLSLHSLHGEDKEIERDGGVYYFQVKGWEDCDCTGLSCATRGRPAAAKSKTISV